MADAAAHLGQRYTMASERQLHDQFGGSSSADGAKADDASQAGDDGNLDDLFL
jgi:hypothetical protein